MVIVENEKACTDQIRRGLGSVENSYRLSIAATLEEARVLLASDPPDIMILDPLLPDGMGEDLLPVNPEDIRYPIIIMTSFGDDALSAHLKQRGISDHITKSKPVFDDLPHIIERTIRNWKIREENRRLERELTTNKSVLQTLINNPVNSIALLDRDGIILDLNGTLADRLGLSVSEVIGTCVYDLIPEPLAQTRHTKIDTVFKTGVADRFEDERDGRWYDNFIQPVPDNAGNVIRVIINARDITESKMAEDRLRKAEETWKKLFSILPIGVSVVNDQNVIVDFNKALSDILEMPKKALKKKTYEHRKYLRPDSTEMPREEFPSVRSLREEKTIRNVQIGVVREDGGVIWTEVSAAPLSLPEKSVVLVTSDITERKKAEEELRINQSRLETAMEIGNFAWWEMDLPGGNVRFHDRKATFLGYPPQQFRHYTDFTDLLHPDDHEPAMRAMRDHLEGRAPTYDIEYRIRTDDGTYRWFRDVGGITRRNPDGTPVTVTGMVVDITRTKETELALRASEEKYRFLVENMEDIVWQTTPDLQFTYLSPATQKMTGYTATDLIGTSLFSLMTEQSAGVIRERLNLRKEEVKLGKKELATVFEVELMKKNGDTRWMEVSSKTVTGSDGALLGFQGITRDITIRKRAEGALHESEERYRTLIDELPDYILVHREGELLYVNASGAKKLGYLPEDLLHTDILRYISPDCHKVIRKSLKKRKEGTSLSPYEVKIITREGSIRWVQIRGALITYEGQSASLNVLTDITERKYAEKALAESERKFRTLADFTYDWEYWVKPDGKFIYISPSCERITGYTPEEFFGDKNLLSGIVHPEDQAIFANHLDTVENTPRTEVIEFRIITKEGSTIWIRHKCQRVSGPGGKDLGRRVSNQDITERRLAEAALRASEEKFRILFNRMTEGNALHEIVYDSAGNPIDYRILDVNKSFEYIIGLTREEVIGKTSREAYRVSAPPFLDIYARVADSNEPEIFESYFEPMKKYFAISAYSPGKGRFATIFQDITERRWAEDALRESEEKFRSMVDTSPDMIWEVDIRGNFTYISSQCRAQLGYSPDELIGSSMFSFIRPESVPDITTLFQAHVKDISSFTTLEVPSYRREGSPCIIEIRSVPITRNNGDLIGFRGIARDITERKKAEEKLVESEARYRKLYESMSDAFVSVTMSGFVREHNQTFSDMLGYTEEELGRMTYSDLTPEKWHTGEERIINEQILVRGFSDIYEKEYCRKDGTIFPVELRTFLIRNDNGQPERMWAIVRDITERKRAEEERRYSHEELQAAYEQLAASEEALKEKQIRLATAMDMANLVSWEFNVGSGIFSFNDRFYNLYGTTAEREGGYFVPAETYVREFVHPDDVPYVRSIIAEVATVTDPSYSVQMEYRIVRRDGHVRYIVVNYGVIMDSSGNLIRTFGVNQDITDRKMMEEEIRSLNRALEQRVIQRTSELNTSLKEKELLLREIHHRVKNNLQIVASLFNLQSRYIKDKNILEAVRESQNRVRAMALVHERIYRSNDISKINLRDYVKYLADQLLRFHGISSSKIRITIDIPDIETDIDTMIPLGLIINELLSNSLKHAFPETGTGNITIRGCRTDGTLEFHYQDDGVGIPEGFDWRNSDSLGLRLVVSLVEQLKGSIVLEPGPGTGFTIVVSQKRA